MIEYLIPLLGAFTLSLFFDFFNIIKSYSVKLFSLFIILFYITLLIGLRYLVGGDSYFYQIYFESINNNDVYMGIFNDQYPLIFSLLTRIIYDIYNNFIFFQLIHVLIINIFLFNFIVRNTKYFLTATFLAFVLFYLNFTVEILRESLAVILFLVSYKYLEKENYVKYLFIIIIASQIHLSALILILFVFNKYLKVNKSLFIIIGLILISLLLIDNILILLKDFTYIYGKLKHYLSVEYSLLTIFLFLIPKGILPLCLCFWAKFKNIKIKFEGLICCSLVLAFSCIYDVIIFSRFYNYLFPFVCVSMADILINLFRCYKLLINKLIVYIFFLFLISFSSILSFYWPSGYYNKWIPYYSIFSNEYDAGIFYER